MEKKCKKCGTTQNVNFDGMCKECYEDSIVVHEKTEQIENEKKPIYKKWWLWGVIVIIVICMAGNDSNNTTNISTSANSAKTSINNVSNSASTKKEKIKVTVIDFSQMQKEEIQNWCNTNKVNCSIQESYSDTVEKGMFASQSVPANTEIYEGDKITITYSLGKEPTLGQKNALSKAKDYLKMMAFSYKGLIEQLEYEGYSTEEATYGVDNCGADWNEQASKKAKDYMDMMSFSKSGLIEQLEYEGFTKEQAQHGATSVGY